MNLIIKIAFRNLARQKRRTFFTGGMIAAGYILFSLFLSIAEGSYGLMIDLFTKDHTGHVQVHRQGYLDKPSIYNVIQRTASLETILGNDPEVLVWSPRVYTMALGFVGKKTTGVKVVGILPSRENSLTQLARRIETGRLISERPSHEVLIGGGIQEILKAQIGDELVLISQGADGSIANDLFTIVGVLKGGQDSSNRMNAYIHIDDVQEFLSLGKGVHEYAMILPDYRLARKAALRIQQKVDGKILEVAPWQVVEKQFFEFMTLDKRGNYVTQVIILLIVIIGILNTVLMTILERTREFGVLKALGTKPKQIFWLIVAEISLLSVISIGIGIVIAFGINFYFTYWGIRLSTAYEIEGIIMDRMVGELSFFVFWEPALVTFFSAFFVSVFPALRAAKVVPVKALSTH